MGGKAAAAAVLLTIAGSAAAVHANQDPQPIVVAPERVGSKAEGSKPQPVVVTQSRAVEPQVVPLPEPMQSAVAKTPLVKTHAPKKASTKTPVAQANRPTPEDTLGAELTQIRSLRALAKVGDRRGFDAQAAAYHRAHPRGAFANEVRALELFLRRRPANTMSGRETKQDPTRPAHGTLDER